MKFQKAIINLVFVMMLMSSSSIAKIAQPAPTAQSAQPAQPDQPAPTKEVVTDKPASVSEKPQCFLSNVDEILKQFEEKADAYKKKCSIKDKATLSAILDLTAALGRLEAQLKKNGSVKVEDLNKLKAIKVPAAVTPSLDAFVKKQKLIIEDFDMLIREIYSYLDGFSGEEHYPTPLIENFKTLISVTRGYERIKNYYKDHKVCYEPNEQNFQDLGLINDDIKKDCDAHHGDDFTIEPFDFEKGGVAFSFWILEDATQLPSSVFNGFIKNKKEYDFSLQGDRKDANSIINQFKAANQDISLTAKSDCAELAFVLVSFEQDCDHYKMTVSIRTTLSDRRLATVKNVQADEVEGLKINFIRPEVKNPKIHKNFVYSESEETRVLLGTVNGLDKLISSYKASCENNPGCKYFSNIDKCQECKKGYYLHKKECVKKCPDGTFAKDGKCNKCSEHCLLCKNEDHCGKCEEGFFYNPETGKCLDKCPDNHYADKAKNCKPCDNNCEVCLGPKQCQICIKDYWLHKGVCVKPCPNGFYGIAGDKECKPCSDSCEQCESLKKCKVCKKGYFMKDGICVKDCGDGQFEDPKSLSCQPCNDHCKECKNGKECQECNKGFYLTKKGTCVTDCPDGYVESNGVCVACADKNCLDCDANNVSNCSDCKDKFFLKDGKCVDDCGDGFFPDAKGNCVECNTNCKTCNKDKCLLCEDNHFLLNDQECPEECPDGYIASGNTCVQCKDPDQCKKCTEKNTDVCSKCYQPKLLKEGQCVTNCGEGYYRKDDQCHKCIEGCKYCKDAFSCRECEIEYFFKEGICVKDCGKGYTILDRSCVKCKVNNCEECIEEGNICNKCEPPKLLYGNTCYEKCPNGTFMTQKFTCEDCSKYCEICESSKKCDLCKKPKVLQENDCVDVCKDGYRPNIEGICEPCDDKGCSKCNNKAEECEDCKKGTLLFNKKCVPQCPTGYYSNGEECLKCEEPCLECKNNAKECTSCIKGFALTDSKKCTDDCPDGTVMNKKTRKCEKCQDEGCNKCIVENLKQCIECKDPLKVLKGDCYKDCPEGYYASEGKCLPCMKGCMKCKSGKYCGECDKGFYLKNGVCVPECGDGWIEVKKTCVQCKSNCVECKPDDTSHCTKCPKGTVMLNGKCLANCPDKYWQSGDVCKPCLVEECIKCSKSGEKCNECKPVLLLDDNQCVDSCPKGKVADETGKKCIDCAVKNCDKCPQKNVKSCTECEKGTFLVDDYTCSKDCPSGTFKNIENKTCDKCKDNCISCSDSKTCSKCKNGFYLQDNECVKVCKPGFREDPSGVCKECGVTNCDKCNVNDCLKCKDPLVLHDDKCIEQCPKGYYQTVDKLNNAKVCKKCSIFCIECDNEKTCNKCDKEHVLSHDKTCIDECPSGSVNIKGKCEHCQADEKCKKCNTKDLKECVICEDKLVLLNNKCVSDCGKGYYEENGVCKICKNNCLDCQDSKSCYGCKKNYFLYNQECVEDCPCGYYKENGKCVPCDDSNCETCSKDDCKKCYDNFYLEEGKCKTECSTGYYLFNDNECKTCPDHCIKCENGETCNICASGYYLKNGQCVKDCGPKFYIKDNATCEPCEKDCLTCESSTECNVCVKPNVLLNGDCKPECPVGYYPDKHRNCQPCLENCDKCTNEGDCQKCKADFHWDAEIKKCLAECRDGYVSQKNKCDPCEVTDCKNCSTDISKCDECDSDKFKHKDKCVPECPETGYFLDVKSKECKSCPTNCLMCKSSDICGVCEKGFVMNDGQCTNECDDGEAEIDETCVDCKVPDCKTCSPKDIKNCQQCKNGLVVNVPYEEAVKSNTLQKCTKECQEGYYENKGICTPCNNKLCKKCSNSETCDVCKEGAVMENGVCKEKCSEGYVERNGKCYKCEDSNCKTCDNLTLKECKLCIDPYKLKNGDCVKDCGKGFWVEKLNESNHCRPCNDNCDKCSNSKICDTCSKGFYLKEGKCVKDCGDNYALVNGTECKKCSQKDCKECSASDLAKCVTCIKPNFLTIEGTCTEDCDTGFYEKETPKRSCVECTDKHCLDCTPEDHCNVCEKGMFLYNGKCVAKCLDGFYVNNNNECKPCGQKTCKVCSANKPEDCKECDNGLFLLNKQCVTKCPDGTFVNDKKECQSCSDNCITCVDETECNECKKPFILDHDLECTDNCDKGYVEVNRKCEKCKDEHCSQCKTDKETCTNCDAKFFLFKGDCVEKCPPSTFLKGRECFACEKECAKCQDDKTCDICKAPKIEQDGDCVDQCRKGYVAINGHCKNCQGDKCEVCNKDNLKKCIKCVEPFILNHDHTCVKTCPAGYFYNEKTEICDKCDSTCADCESKEICKKCKSPLLLFQDKCVKNCPDGHVEDKTGTKCEPCKNENCMECEPANTDVCTDCYDKEYKIMRTDGYDCVKKCPEGFYLCVEDQECVKCQPQCKTCEKDKCFSCREGFYLSNGECVTECPKGYVAKEGKCHKCTEDDCEVCDATDLNKCRQCQKGKILFNHECIDKCPEKHYHDTEQNTCVKCPVNCKECNKKACLVCQDKFYFKKNTSNCDECEQPNLVIGKRCFPCEAQNCDLCVDKKPEICKVCNNKTVLHNGKCLDKCPTGFYKQGNKCIECSEDCAACSSEDKCEVCQEPKVIFEGKCVDKCPDRYSEVDGKCLPCSNPDCVLCASDLKTCTKCDAGRILFKGNCVDNCPEKYHLNNNKCEKCPDSCKICDAISCKECIAPLKVKGKICVKECGEGFFDNGKRCEPCLDSKCIKCSPANICQICQDGSFLIPKEGKCVDVCPDGSFPNKKTKTCEECDKFCKKCSSKDNCYECKNDLLLHNGKCLKDCPKGFTAVNDRCVKCTDKNCLDCLPGSPEKCSECTEETALYKNTCESECPRGTFERDNQCFECDSKCQVCTDEKSCKKCKPEFFLTDKKCVNNCPDGKVPVDGKCVDCADKDCKACASNVTQCLDCFKPHKLYEDRCITNCPEGYFDDKKGKCALCPSGCETCTDSETCQKCRKGWYFKDDKCLASCGEDYYGDCSDDLCKKCDPSCDQCVAGTYKDCIDCAKGFYRDLNTCVKPSDCREGTYPNHGTKECNRCNLAYCEKCSDEKTCSKCTRGFTLNKQGQCVVGNTFSNVVSDTQQIDTRLLSNKNMVISPNKFNSVGVGSNVVTVTFWYRLNAPISVKNEGTVIYFNNKVASGIALRINNKTQKCKVTLSRGEKDFEYFDAQLCDYSNLNDWTFFTLSIIKNEKDLEVTLTTHKTDNKPVSLSHTFSSSKTRIDDILVNDADLVIGTHPTLPDTQDVNIAEIYNVNIMDYVPKEEAIEKFKSPRPSECDYFCTSCEQTCKKCIDNALPVDGHCPAVGVSIYKGLLKYNKESLIYPLTKLTKDIVSQRYGFSTWFYSNDAKDSTLVSFEFKQSIKETLGFLELRLKGNAMVLTDNTNEVKVSPKEGIKANRWYYVSFAIGKLHQEIWLHDSDTKEQVTSGKSQKNLIFLREVTATQIVLPDSFKGNYYDPAVYVNNYPNAKTVKKDVDDYKCDEHCSECSSEMVCKKCDDGYIFKDGKCVLNTSTKDTTLLERMDFWADDVFEKEINSPTFPYSITFFLRKKIHSNVTINPTFNILSFAGKNGKVFPLVQDTIKEKFTSTMSFSGVSGSTPQNIDMDYNNKIFDYIYVELILDGKTLTYTVHDLEKDASKTFKFDFNVGIEKLILGQRYAQEMNWEVTWLKTHMVAISKAQSKAIIGKLPKDCNPACQSECDLETGFCGKCFNGKSGEKCSTYLVGFKNSFIYLGSNPKYTSIKDDDTYKHNLLDTGFNVGVNSLGYSLFGHIYLFDLPKISKDTEIQQRLISVGNLKDNRVQKEVDTSSGLIALDVIINKKGQARISWILNSSTNYQRVDVENFDVKENSWISLHAAIDVVNKKFKFIIQDSTDKKNYLDEIDLDRFPEKLQEIGGIRIFGVGDNLPATYVVPAAKFANVYFSPNTAFKRDLFDKYMKYFHYPAPLDCPKDCENCAKDNSNNVICIKCQEGFISINNECVEHQIQMAKNFNYLVLNDTPLLKPSQFEVKQNTFNPTDGFSISFFLRTNYVGKLTKPKLIISREKLNVYIIQGKSETYISADIAGNSSPLRANIENEYNWNSVILTFANNKAEIYVISEHNKRAVHSHASVTLKTKYLDNSTINANPHDMQFGIFGIHLVSTLINKPFMNWPMVDCEFDCAYCLENVCKACLYGTERFGSEFNGRCAQKKIYMENEYASSSTSIPVKIHADDYIRKDKQLRTNTWTLEFTFETKVTGIIPVAVISNEKNFAQNLDFSHISVQFITKTGEYVVEYYSRRLGASKSFTVGLKQPPTNSQQYVAISVQNNYLYYFFFDSRDNNVHGSKNMEGRLDYLTNDATFSFFNWTTTTDKTLVGFVRHIRFAYSHVIQPLTLVYNAEKIAVNVQSLCSSGSVFECNKCSEGSKLVQGYCVPEQTTPVYWHTHNHVATFSRWSQTTNTLKSNLPDSLLNSFTSSFWWRPTGLLQPRQSLLKQKLVGGGSQNELLNIIYTNKNALEINVQWTNGKYGTWIIPDVYDSKEIYDWQNVAISLDNKTADVNIIIYLSKTGRIINKFFSLKKEKLDSLPIKGKVLYTSIGISDKEYHTTENNSFDFSTFVFLSNVALRGADYEDFRIIKPRRCRTPCKTSCVKDVCPSDKRISKDINVGNHFLGSEWVQKTNDLSHLNELPLFRPLVFDGTITESQTFTYYILSFDLDVNNFLSAKYSANKNIVFLLHNNNKQEYEMLSMNDLIPSSLISEGAISLVYKSGKLILFKGYNPSTNAVDSIEVPLGGKPLKSYSKVYLSILVDVYNNTSRMVVITDNVQKIIDISGPNYSSPINYYTLIYNHPSVEKLNLNVYNPRLGYDLSTNAQSHIQTDFSSNLCSSADEQCRSCLIPENSMTNYCLDCRANNIILDGACREAFKSQESEGLTVDVNANLLTKK